MMIVMKEGASRHEVDAVIARVESVGAKAHVSEGELVTVIGAIGDREHVANLQLDGYPGVTELMDVRALEAVAEVADVIQLGARNMSNFPLLTEVGRTDLPVLLKRGLSATLEDLLMAAEYILKEGNEAVMLCERGIRTFETSYRFTLDLMAVPVLKQLSHLPIVVDPSRAAGRRDLVLPLSLAAAAAGADGIIVETHPEPDNAICDGPQQLLADEFGEYLRKVEAAAELAGKEFSRVA